MMEPKKIKAVLFDFGGVVAEEGFMEGLRTIARKNDLDPEVFLMEAFEIVYDIGLVLGKVRDDIFWQIMRERFPINGDDDALREEVLSRFDLRPWMLEIASDIKARGLVAGILSDHCHWLDELNKRFGFFKYFDPVFNSYHIHMSKKEPAVFDFVSRQLNIPPGKILFIDDHEAHILRAKGQGLQAILYVDRPSFLDQLNRLL